MTRPRDPWALATSPDDATLEAGVPRTGNSAPEPKGAIVTVVRGRPGVIWSS